jgi:hypothetical protein
MSDEPLSDEPIADEPPPAAEQAAATTRPPNLRMLTAAIGFGVPVVLGSLAWGVMAATHTLPGLTTLQSPLRTGLLLVVLAIALFLACLIGATLASWTALKRYPRSAVAVEFRWLLWLPKAGMFNNRLFERLFPEAKRGSEP